MIPRVAAIALLLAHLTAPPAIGHDLHWAVTAGEATVLRLFYADDTAFSYEAYEIYREGEEIPFQVGRTDALGRIAFIPDRAGSWRVKAFSEDGHGVDFTVAAGPAGELLGADKPFFDRYLRIVVGVAIIFGLFGTLKLFAGRARSPVEKPRSAEEGRDP